MSFVKIDMKHMSRMAFGQPVTAAPNNDKWALLAALTEAAEDHGLNHRTLGVLRALLSFYPDRALPREPGTAVVFPSNATLSQRLNGMPESTLRRHLATLVKIGIVSRQDSPNRKRFARRHGLAFGFDLSPLACAAEALLAAAERARERRDALAILRDRLALVRARLLEVTPIAADDPDLEAARLILRRKARAEDLTAMLDTLEPRLAEQLPTPQPTDKMSASDSRNERHIQSTNKITLVGKSGDGAIAKQPDLSEVLENCNEYKSYFPATPPNWQGLITVSNRLHAMIGIAPSVYQLALRALGPERAATAVLCMLERIGQIRNPCGYLRALVTRSRTGDLNLDAMVRACRTP